MPFLQHLGELRKRLTVVVIVLIVGVAILYFFTDPILKIMLAPVSSSLHIKPIVLGPLDALGVRIQLSLWASVVITSPITIWQIMAFLLPALKERERKFVVPTFAAMVILFLGGVALCYFVILQFSFGWLVSQAGTTMTSMLTAQDTITVVQFFLLAFGIAFELPVIIFYLVYFGVIPYRKLRKSWRTAYLVIATTACLVTPDWSPVTMIALAVAMVILYEGTMLACKIVLRHRISAQDDAALALEEA